MALDFNVIYWMNKIKKFIIININICVDQIINVNYKSKIRLFFYKVLIIVSKFDFTLYYRFI